jgi:activator of 2-hydroxyglutaryl-CoA dehydratase
MARYMGIDIGSVTSKGVILRDGNLEAYQVLSSGVDYRLTVQDLGDKLLIKAGLLAGDIAGTVAIGHGAGIIPSNNPKGRVPRDYPWVNVAVAI